MSSEMLNDTTDREIVITRTFNAPRELIWKVWTTPEHMAQWWGPRGFTTTVIEMDVRTGGTSRYIMHVPDGTDYKNQVDYLEVVEGARLEYMHGAYDDPDFKPFHGEVTFEDKDGQTQVTLRMRFDTAEERGRVVEFAVEGGNSTLDCLEEYLKTVS